MTTGIAGTHRPALAPINTCPPFSVILLPPFFPCFLSLSLSITPYTPLPPLLDTVISLVFHFFFLWILSISRSVDSPSFDLPPFFLFSPLAILNDHTLSTSLTPRNDNISQRCHTTLRRITVNNPTVGQWSYRAQRCAVPPHLRPSPSYSLDLPYCMGRFNTINTIKTPTFTHLFTLAFLLNRRRLQMPSQWIHNHRFDFDFGGTHETVCGSAVSRRRSLTQNAAATRHRLPLLALDSPLDGTP